MVTIFTDGKRLPLFLFFPLVLVALASAARAQDSFPFTAVTTTDQVRVRAGQSQNYEDLTNLQLGEEVVVVDKDYSWYKIKLPARAQCYIVGKYVQDLGDNIGRIIGDSVNLRARASAESAPLGHLNKGDLVKIVTQPDQQTGDWYRIEPAEQGFGWVREDLLRFKSKQIPPPRTIDLPLKNIFQGKGPAELAQVPNNQLPTSSAQGEKQEKAPVLVQQVVAVGIIEGLGDKSLTQNIRHGLTADDGAYFLQGYRSMLDSFLNLKVRVEGTVNPDIKAPHPVILVTKVQLIL